MNSFSLRNSSLPTSHYYGNVTRALIFAASLVMLVGLPFFTKAGLISVPYVISINAIILLVLVAGMLSPAQPKVMIASGLLSLIGFVVFENIAVSTFLNGQNAFFLANQLLAILFLVALYYDVKSVRGYYLKSKPTT